jgi:hypothetical protein
MYAIELDGRHVGLTLRGHKLGTSKGKRVVREILIKNIFSIRHFATKVQVVEQKKVKKTYWTGAYTKEKITVFELNDEVEVEGESIAN